MKCAQSTCVRRGHSERFLRNSILFLLSQLLSLRLVHLLSGHPKLHSTILSHIEDLQLAEAEESEEGWENDQEHVEPDAEYIEPDYEEGLEEEVE